MPSCPLYHIRKTFHESTLPGAGDAAGIYPWCGHKHPPVTESHTYNVGGDKLLRCQGDLEHKCQVDPAKLADSGNALFDAALSTSIVILSGGER